ncbi:MAG: histidine kinase [Alphaproteobacteria bacterium]|nr:histidine kinase [Alphaproteobacteria bacterium]
MLDGWFILFVSFAYLCLLFAIAYYGDKRADERRSLANNPYIYALSIAVYCTSWTFYGSVGRAASSGVDFLPIYLGPTLTFALWWFVLVKIIRITKINRITSIADFLSSRYGKSTQLSGLVTVIAVVGILPYISLQLKAVSTSFTVLLSYPEIVMPSALDSVPVFQDTALLVALVLGVFAILFGTRHIDASEHHEGMVVAVAFESVVKLVAFLAIGIFVTFGLYNGFGDLFTKAAAVPAAERLFVVGGGSDYARWVTLIILSMAAILCLPRQFQVTVVENLDESHLKKAIWLFPLYLLVINIFVLPIALAGLLQFPAGMVDADTFVLTIPMAHGQEGLALFAFIGGLSAATGMVIVATIALSTMVCNDLVMPVLLRLAWLRLAQRGELTGLLLAIRRGAIIGILLLSYIYFRYIGESYALVTIGLISFAAAAQFAPAIIGGIFWKGATRMGALVGLSLGFAVWFYTLLLPSFALSGWLPTDFIDHGPGGVELLKPYELFALQGFDRLSHALFWSMLANIGGYVAVSLFSRQSAIERIQATLFVDVLRQSREPDEARFWRGTATVADLYNLVTRFVGRSQADRAFAAYGRRRNINLKRLKEADADLVNFAERLLAGAIGAASARVMVSSVTKGDIVSIDEVMEILDEASHVIEHSHQLEQKSRELQAATAQLRAANERLKELDRLKDDFIATVSHELRTPLTSVRSFGEILHDNPDLDAAERQEYLHIIITESERLTRLINEVLDLAKMEAGRMEWHFADVDPRAVVEEAVAITRNLFKEKSIALDVQMPEGMRSVHADRDRLFQVVVNLLSNAVKFCDGAGPKVTISAQELPAELRIAVEDNGVGIPREAQEMIFEKFQQVGDTLGDKPFGTGLGLPICRQIVQHFGGRIWVESRPGQGSRFTVAIPYATEAVQAAQ